MNREDLLAIDVASEIRSLCEAQLRGTWQMPAELVRLAIRSGATKVVVTAGRRRFSVGWENAPIERSTLESLATAFDESVEAASRQQAIAELESSGAEALLWGGGVPGAKLKVDRIASGRRTRLNRIDGHRPRLAVSDDATLKDGVAIQWGCSKLDRRRAVMWLRMACRFADAEVLVNGQPIDRGFVRGLYQVSLGEPLPCTIGLTRRGEEPVLWLLRDGVVAARATVPGYPSFEAAVELGGVVRGVASSSDLRRQVTPFVAELSDRAAWMMIQVAGRSDRLTGPDGQRLVALLLHAARRNLRMHEIRALPLLSSLGGGEQLLSLVRLEALARRRGGRLSAIDRGEDTSDLLVDPGTVIVASSEVRSLLSDVTGIQFQSPPRRRAGLVRRLTDGLKQSARWVSERTRGALRHRVLPAAELTDGERRVLSMLRAVISPRTVEIGDGGRLCRTSSGFVLPRTDPALVAAARLVDDEPAWLYPLALALRIGREQGGALQNRWKSLVARL